MNSATRATGFSAWHRPGQLRVIVEGLYAVARDDVDASAFKVLERQSVYVVVGRTTMNWSKFHMWNECNDMWLILHDGRLYICRDCLSYRSRVIGSIDSRTWRTDAIIRR